jgi:hypothetical protein
MFLAQRRTGTYLALAASYAAAFFALVIPGAFLGGLEQGATGAAIAAGIALTLLGPIAMRLAIAPMAGTWSMVARAYTTPLAASAIAFVPAWFAVRLFPATMTGELAALAAIGSASSVLYLAMIYWLAPSDVREIIARVRALMRREQR